MMKKVNIFLICLCFSLRLCSQTIAGFKLASHPRLFFPKGEETAVMARAAKNPLLAQMIDVLRKEADKTLEAAPQTFRPAKELLAESREEVRRIVTLAMAYRLFRDEKYAQKVEAELINVCGWGSWNPKHFLDVAEMTTAVAVGYDWCYDYLQPATKKKAETAILNNALAPAWPLYQQADKGKSTPVSRENNWNMVCNSGLVNGAIAIADKDRGDADKVIEYAVRYTPNLLKSFAPEGVYNEGPGYWAFNAMYMSLFFDNLQRNVGNSFGLPLYPGISNTAAFYTNLVGPSGMTFNFGDAGTRVDNSEAFFFLSHEYHQPEVAAGYRRRLASLLAAYGRGEEVELGRLFFLNIPWFDEAEPSVGQEEVKLNVFQGMTDFLFFNGESRSDASRLYLGAKTGRPEWSHNHLDVGSFVLDCDGERWAMDLGPDSYKLDKFWDYGGDGQRWTYFRMTNLAHNTLNIDGKITHPDGQGELLSYDRNAVQPFGIFDMTAAYAGQASSVQRGFRMLGSTMMLVQDEIVPEAGSSVVSWRMLTAASVRVDGNMVTLTQNGKTFYVKCLLKDGYSLTVQPAKPSSSAEKPIEGVSIIEIAIPMKGGAPVTIPVLLGNELAALQQTEVDEPLKNWGRESAGAEKRKTDKMEGDRTEGDRERDKREGDRKETDRTGTENTLPTTQYKNTLPRPDLIRGPYLQAATPVSLLIRWRTDALCRSRVRFGAEPGRLTSFADDSSLVTEHKVQLKGLTPGTRYYYSIGSLHDTLQGDSENYFSTLPPVGKDGDYRIGVFGDCGTNNITQRKVRDAFLHYLGGAYPDAWLLLGDNAYENGTDAQYQTDFFNIYRNDLLKHTPLFPAPGNHEYGNVDFRSSASPDRMFEIAYYQDFSVPAGGESGGVASHQNAYYSYDIGGVHFLSLDSYGAEENTWHLYDTLGPQVRWVKKDLEANRCLWVVAYWHHPPYTMGSHNSDKEPDLVKIRENFIRILERYGVDLVLCGHSHIYERSGLMRGYYGMEGTFDSSRYLLPNRYRDGAPVFTKDRTNEGTVYVVAGSAGKVDIYCQPAYPHDAMRFSDNEHGGAALLEVKGRQLEWKWVCEDGVVRDRFVMEK